MDFKLPDIGEGIAEGEILKWLVKEGDQVKEDQPIVEIMTDKVNVQIPAPRGGKVTRILAKEGDVAKVGETIMVIDEGGTGETQSPRRGNPQPHSGDTSTPKVGAQAPEAGPPAAQAKPPQMAEKSSVAPVTILATPATRKLARELGVEITAVRGSGPQGRVTEDDVRHVSKAGPSTESPTTQPQSLHSGLREEVVPLRGVRKTIAQRMVASLTTAAQVTHVDEVDVTELVLLREAFKGSADKRGVRLTYLPFIIKALVPALKAYPYLNSSLDDQGGNIVLKKYYNVGIATDTEQGLVVPVVKEVDKKDIFELAGDIEKLADKARRGSLTLDEVRGSTFTITNVGAIGGLFATPIINLPEAAILGLHKISKRPVVRDGKVDVRDTTYLSLTFDHRIVDGAYAARFTSMVIDTIQDTKKLLSEVL